MARFKYSGRDRTGVKNGTLNASSRREAMLKLRNEGIRIIEIEEVPETFLTKDIAIGNPVKLQHMVIFMRQFSTLLQAGVTVVEATRILGEQTESKPLKKALLEVEQELREGHPLSESLAKHDKIFEPLFIHMISAGEISGTIDETLDRLSDHYEKQHHTRQKVGSALAYPIVVGMIAIGVIIFLLVGVVPTFVSMFADFGGELPMITRFVLNASEFMQSFWYIFVLLGLLLAVGLVFMRKNTETKYYLDYALTSNAVFRFDFSKSGISSVDKNA